MLEPAIGRGHRLIDRRARRVEHRRAATVGRETRERRGVAHPPVEGGRPQTGRRQRKAPVHRRVERDRPTGKAVAEGVYYYECEVFENRLQGEVRRDRLLSGYIQLIRGQNP